MRSPSFIGPRNPVRAWARRISRSSRARPDVLIGQLARRLELLERLVSLPEGAEASVEEAVRLLSPRQFADLPLERIGSTHDGGYVLPAWSSTRCSGVVSIGVGTNNDCDVVLAGRGLPVHAWDHTVSGLPRQHEGITFHQVGLGTGVDLLPLDDLVRASFGSSVSNLILLLDAEGAEWEALAGAPHNLLSRFDAIAVEFHDLGEIMLDAEPILSTFRSLREHLVPVAVHVNNHGPVWRVGPWDWPDALEVTFVRRDLVEGPDRVGNGPSTLLAPCCADLPDPEIEWTL